MFLYPSISLPCTTLVVFRAAPSDKVAYEKEFKRKYDPPPEKVFHCRRCLLRLDDDEDHKICSRRNCAAFSDRPEDPSPEE